MQDPIITLDHVQGIVLDPSNPPFPNYQALQICCFGMKYLADAVREFEIKVFAGDPNSAYVSVFCDVPPIIPCAFNWFSVTVVNYFKLVALVDLMAKNNWKSSALATSANRHVIKEYCNQYVDHAVPEIFRWRNKVAAHFAATAPFSDDTLGTLELSIMNTIGYKSPYYYVGMVQLNTWGTSSDLPMWSLTETYEHLQKRYWPDMNLREIPKNGL